MAAVSIRNISDEVHRALRVRAAHHGRSTEAEIRDIIERAVRPPERVKLGTFLFGLGREIGLTNEDVACIEQGRDRTPVEPVSFAE
ncbi:MAG: plasmid stabilization protein [Zoogloeaceae bacterium]|jgi:plasmid stability protein|nr:plasmid stabilization protein [Zoogloeaceae bacterium]